MDSLDYWRLCEDLTVFQAAMLVVGSDPSVDSFQIERDTADFRPHGYDAAKHAIKRALLSQAIDGNIVNEYHENPESEYPERVPDTVDIDSSIVVVESLKSWLVSRGFATGFFFPQGASGPAYLDRKNERYAPKLAAAVRAWMATDGDDVVRGKSPKQALTKWLRENAATFGLTDEDGKPNETGIEEVAKVANWRPLGGAPKTPG
ncbi:MAG: hypothetical protein KDA64_01605 [Rhodospirillaceae bacterium]|nr:hypothetical protein [Rhodospirillaceae bacterium]